MDYPIPIDDKVISEIEKLISEGMVKYNTPGLALAIVHDNDTVYVRGFGSASKNIEANENTVFNIASITKSFVALAIMQLAEQGRIDIGDPISNYFPLELGFDDEPILIHHLLSHSSGIPNLDDNLYSKDDYANFGITDIPNIPYSSWNDYFRHINGAKEFVTEKPGKRFYYLNTGYTLLGRLIEITSNMSLSDYIKENIFEPLHMNRSTLSVDDLQKMENVAQPYLYMDKHILIKWDDNEFVKAAGGMFSSVYQMGNYMKMMFSDGKFNDTKIISKDTISLMHSIQFEESFPNTDFKSFYGDYGKTGYGYGWVVQDDFYGYKLVHHSGSYFGSSAWFAMIPELKIGTIILTNQHPSPRMYALAVLSMLLGKEPKAEFKLFSFQSKLKTLSGIYHTYANVETVEIVQKGNMLFMKNLTLDKFVPEEVLIPNIEKSDDNNIFYSTQTEIGEFQVVEFNIDGDQIWLQIERNKYRKE
jgi:CubicO group peptidase (beta-lactamase class C family)